MYFSDVSDSFRLMSHYLKDSISSTDISHPAKAYVEHNV